jgi:hypothetical protein
MGYGLFTLGLVTMMLGAAVGGVLYQREIGTVARRVKERVSPPPEPPPSLPIERIARNARRLRPQVLVPAPGTPLSRRIAVTQAYDDLLGDACQAVGIPDTLTGLPLGLEREAERLRVEHELDAAGVRLIA